MAKRKKPEEHENHERWLVSYADFITLLFAFFVVLYATSSRNENKEKEFQKSIRNFMKIMSLSSGGGSSSAITDGGVTGSMIESGEGIKFHYAENNIIEKEVNRVLDTKLSPQERRSMVPVVQSESGGIRITLSTAAMFARNSAKMQKGGTKAISAIAEVLKATPFKIQIIGHTDNTPVQGNTFESNWELSGARASSVLRFLSKVYQIPEKKMSVLSMADQKPIVENTTEENRSRNRRVEILITTKEEAEE
jgi:chemotaxis protein MotB